MRNKKARLAFARAKRGFTLIELLVVIAIIGLLSSLAVVNLNSARAKARDARRLSDIKQLSTILEMTSTEGTAAIALEGCTLANDLTTACTGPGQVVQFLQFKDPSTPLTACVAGATATCGYSIAKATGAAGATASDYQICFYLEEASGSLAKGINAIEPGGQFGNCD